jgi:hypothetical protein
MSGHVVLKSVLLDLLGRPIHKRIQFQAAIGFFKPRNVAAGFRLLPPKSGSPGAQFPQLPIERPDFADFAA